MDRTEPWHQHQHAPKQAADRLTDSQAKKLSCASCDAALPVWWRSAAATPAETQRLRCRSGCANAWMWKKLDEHRLEIAQGA